MLNVPDGCEDVAVFRYGGLAFVIMRCIAFNVANVDLIYVLMGPLVTVAVRQTC